MEHLSINQIIVDIMVIFMAIGGLDRIFGNRLKLGEQFAEGFYSMGSIALGMVGFVCLAPVLADWLSPIVVPIYTMLGADPSMFATTLLASDMGGYAIAQEMALTPEAGQFSGILLGSMMGPTIVFIIPIALSLVDKADYHFLATGILYGVITIPFGCFIGGVVAGFEMGMILSNLVPIIIVALLIALGLLLIPNGMIKGFHFFGKCMVALGTIGIILAIAETLTGVVIIRGMAPISEAFEILGSIVIVLAGAYPMVTVITKVLRKPLAAFGRMVGINEKAAGGLVASLANSIPMMAYTKEMDPVGKVANFAFMVSGAFVLGDHLGFTASVDKTMVLPLICGKLAGGILAVALAIFATKRQLRKAEAVEQQ